MTEFFKIFASLSQQMTATLSRSDVLRALVWPMGILMAATLGLVVGHAPTWMLILFSTMTALAFILYGASFVFCLIKDRDALRSETYSIKKMAIAQGVYGDNKMGLIDVPTTSVARIIDEADPPEPRAESEE